jgi:hypothetical protein
MNGERANKESDMHSSTYQEELRHLLENAEESTAAFISIRKWAKDRGIVLTMPSTRQARVLVDAYYNVQELRKRLTNQIRASEEAGEPCDTLVWLNKQDSHLETWVKLSLAGYVAGHKMGQWLAEVYGIGPVLAAGLLAHIDIQKAPTVGHIWQYCGLAGSGQKPWKPSTKRPWNAFLKSLCSYKIGDMFIKFHNRPECAYGLLYARRKEREAAKNDAGDFAEQATREASKKSKDSEAWPWNNACYPAGACTAALEIKDIDKRAALLKSVRGEPGSGVPMLHLDHINSRARRYAVKQFLADFHAAWYRVEFGKDPPLPYPIAILGHAHQRHAAE